MESRIQLKIASSTDISALRGKVISFLKLQLMDKSDLTACVLRFFNDTNHPNDEAWLKLVKPGFTTSQILIPEQESCFLVLDYDYCIVTDIHGKPIESDSFTLLLNEIAA